MFKRVLEASKESKADSVTVVGGGRSSMNLASKFGANWLDPDCEELNADFMTVLNMKTDKGFSCIYVPADLPFLRGRDINYVIDASRFCKNIVLVPSIGDGGTSCMLIPKGTDFVSQLGSDSFTRHLAQAEQTGLGVSIVTSWELGLDLDTEEDLNICEKHEPGFISRLAEPLVVYGDN
jgi:2-phospho-L-lactate guanylyltransferase